MQDENIVQPATDNGQADSSADNNSEGLSLGVNPSAQQDTSVSDIPADSTPIADDSASSGEPVAIEPASETPAADDNSSSAGSDSSIGSEPPSDLEAIKASALQELMPLVNELEQEPEDQYRTLMMLIQSSDNKDLVKDAFAAAEKIEDKKAKAEAMLHIINEVNYLTGKTESSDAEN